MPLVMNKVLLSCQIFNLNLLPSQMWAIKEFYYLLGNEHWTMCKNNLSQKMTSILIRIYSYICSADEGFDGTYHTNIVVKSNGSCLYVPPGKKIHCIHFT